MRLILRLEQVAHFKNIYIHPDWKLAFRLHGGHSLGCSADAPFLHGRLLFFKNRVCGLLNARRELAAIFRHGLGMIWFH